ncbi:MAG: aminotransferase class V-fold PLP-dependent enzyme [Alphaproteobacteria bacterium]|nr:aminotransferase class V-fold PLP-dependent enzyme [Alphaproteobacteria bacterium]
MPIDVAKVRADTPGVGNILHFNNAGAALPPRSVVSTAVRHLEREAEIGGYEAEQEAHGRLEAVYASIARLLNCDASEVAVIENATRAWDMAFYSLPLRKGDRILTAMAEYASNYIAFLQAAKTKGVEIVVVPNDNHGQIDVAALSRMIDERTKLIAITHVPTNGGLVNPAAAVGRVARRAGVPFLLDACQSAGQMPLDVEVIGCDMLSATGRKFLRGPRGTGFLYVRKSILEKLEPAFLDLHAATWTSKDSYKLRPDARRFENWETNIAAKLGLGTAVDYALALGLGDIRSRVVSLAGSLRRRLADIPGVSVKDLGAEKCGIVTFTYEGREPEKMRTQLRAKRINAWISGPSSTRLDMEDRQIPMLVRSSVHYYNTEQEILRFCEVVRSL